MSESSGPDPLDRLRAADPFRSDDVPDASLARVSARIQEHIMTEPTSGTASNRRPFALFGGLALSGVLALAVLFGNSLGGVATPPTQTPTQEPGSGPVSIGSCLVYEPASLPTFETVFDGVATAIDGDQVTFEVKTGWKGVGDRVTLTAPNIETSLVGPLPVFNVGGRYLVTAAGDTINACGYTLDYDAKTASEWAAAFGG